MDTVSFVLLVAISFLSAIMGSLVGMAMVIMLPVMVFFGIPVHNAVATARFSMIGISIGNISKFSKDGKIQMKYVWMIAVFGAVGSLLGASLMTLINERALKVTIGVFVIIVSVLVLFEDKMKQKGLNRKISLKHHILSAASGMIIGAYIGIVGGGAATTVIFILMLVYGLSFQDAVANQKAVLLPMSIIATLVFMYNGLIDFKLAIPLFLANIVGGRVGASLILKFKPEWLKAFIVPLSILLALKLIFW